MQIPKIFQSSQDAEQLSLTLKALVPTVLLVTALFKVDFDSVTANSLIDAIIQILTAAGTILSSALTAWGIIRKFIPKKEDFTNLGKDK